MKNIVRAALFCGLFVFSASLHAQQDAVAQLLRRNILKINLSSLVFKNGSFQYEYAIGPRTSFALGISYQPKTGLPFAQTLSEKYGDNPDAKRAIETTQLSGFTITPEYRFYFGSRASTGFYIAPFGRFKTMTFEQLYEFTASNGKVHRPLIGGNIKTYGGGVLFGSQFTLSRHLLLDLWLAGPIYGSVDGELHGTDDMSDLTAADRAKLKSDIENIGIPLTDVKATIGTNRVDVALTGPFVGIRALGFTLGIPF